MFIQDQKSPESEAKRRRSDVDSLEAKKEEDDDEDKKSGLLDQVKSLIGNNKSDAAEAKQLQIDDLIIIPNNLNAAAAAGVTPEGGSALQNLAKIASRYQNKDGKKDETTITPVVKPGAAAPGGIPGGGLDLNTTLSALSALGAFPPGLNPMNMTPQQLLAMLPPGILPPGLLPSSSATSTSATTSTPTKSTAAAASSSSSAMLAMLAGLGPLLTGDPTKLGAESLQLLQFYEKALKSATGTGSTSAAGSATNSTAAASTSKSQPTSRASSRSSTNSPLQSAKDRDKAKINRLPVDAKRPPSLLGKVRFHEFFVPV